MFSWISRIEELRARQLADLILLLRHRELAALQIEEARRIHEQCVKDLQDFHQRWNKVLASLGALPESDLPEERVYQPRIVLTATRKRH